MTPPPGTVSVAYVMSRFPKLSETFVVDEMLGVEAEGIQVEVFPLIRERESLEQPDAHALVERARFQPFISVRMVCSIAAWLFESPRRLVGAVAEALRGVWGSWSFVVGLLGILPKTIHNARVMRDLGIDHIHAHFAHHPALSALIVHRLTGIPFSFTGHGHDIQVDRRMLCQKISAARFAIAVSDYNRTLMAGECPDRADRIAVVHTGVDPTTVIPGAASPWAHARWRINATAGLRILSVGRLEPVKAHEVLVEACAVLRDCGVTVDCLIVGAGPRRADLERLRDDVGLGEHLRFDGSHTRQQVLDLMRSADVVVLPSVRTEDGRIEGIPVVLMEAMAVGTPVVASDLPGVRELIPAEDHGLLFRAGDADALARTVAQLTDVKRAELLGEGGRDRIIAAFDSRTSASKLASMFRESAAATADMR